MANFEGMDTTEVRNRANQAKSVASDWHSKIATLDKQVRGLDWRGKDHDRYLNDWQNAVKGINSACDAINQLTTKLNQNADAQDQTSN